MGRVLLLGLRGAAVAAGSSVMVAGLVFAARGDGSGAIESSGAPYIPITSPTESAPSLTPGSALTTGPTLPAPSSTESPGTSEPSPSATAAATAPGQLAARPVSQPAPATPTESIGTGPITDLPKLTDVQVLGMAANVTLPSGRTFAECVALGPTGQHWPVPVHLYYEGKGKWLVETHLSEVQVEYDEALESFRVKHFAPESSECLKAP
ncbi:MAG: hypothetical protein ABI577_17610 [bacterium]